MISFFRGSAAALLALAAAALHAQEQINLDLPQIGEPADTSLSPSEERALGAEIVSQFYNYGYVLEDPEIEHYVVTLMQRINSGNEAPIPITIFAVKDDRINAFALPGGFIGVNAGTIVSSHTESELASVLSHELAHVTQRHIARSANSGTVATIATWAAVIGAIIAGSADPDVVLAAVSAGQAANYQRQVNYTRSHELEADRLGIRTMAAAGFDPEGMASFFTRLEQQSRLYGNGIPEFLRTHPVNTTRISEARSRISGLAKRKITESADFPFVRARAHALAADSPGDAVEYFSSQRPMTAATRYGLALSYVRLGDYARAQSSLAPALAEQPRQLQVMLLSAKIQMGQSQFQSGLAQYRKALEIYPRSAPTILEYANALIDAGKPEDARKLLLSRDITTVSKADVYRLLSQAARELNQVTEAQFQTANFLVERGDSGGALAALDVALRNAGLSDAERARLKARRDEIRALLPKDWKPKRERDAAR
ncbi:MAG: M48 family metalloprotease [Pseudomonadota bacterium]